MPRASQSPRARIARSIASRQGAALEREVNTYLNDWVPTDDESNGNGAMKRQHCNHGESIDDDMVIATTATNTNLSACLPVQLQLREIGYCSRRPPSQRQNLQCQWIDRMLKTAKGGGTRDDDLGCFITTYPSTTNTSSRWNALQYSAPTYYHNAAIVGVTGNQHDT